MRVRRVVRFPDRRWSHRYDTSCDGSAALPICRAAENKNTLNSPVVASLVALFVQILVAECLLDGIIAHLSNRGECASCGGWLPSQDARSPG